MVNTVHTRTHGCRSVVTGFSLAGRWVTGTCIVVSGGRSFPGIGERHSSPNEMPLSSAEQRSKEKHITHQKALIHQKKEQHTSSLSNRLKAKRKRSFVLFPSKHEQGCSFANHRDRNQNTITYTICYKIPHLLKHHGTKNTPITINITEGMDIHSASDAALST